MIKVLKKTASILAILLTIALLAAVCYTVFCNITNRVAYIGNYAAVRIISPSMEPLIPTNTYILVQRVEAPQVKEGDVILFYSKDPTIQGLLNTHRVVQIEESNGEYSFTTKGDNNTLKDQYPVSGSDVSGRYIKNISWISKFANVFSKPAVFFAVIVLPSMVLLFLAARDVKKSYDEVKHRRAVEEEIKRLENEGQMKVPESETDK